MEFPFNSQYWDEKYFNREDKWDLKSANPVLIYLFEKKILLPASPMLVIGCGKGYDSFFTASKGIETLGIDFSPEAISFAKEFNQRDNLEYRCEDIFSLEENHREEFNCIYEYVTICAVEPERREELLQNIFASLKSGGRFYTVLFPIDGRVGGPPFSIDANEFISLCKKYFQLEFFSKNIPSVKPRKGNEILLIFRK